VTRVPGVPDGQCVTSATEEDTINTESDVSTTASTSIDRVAHAYCALCNPDPEPGQPITALCGATHPFWGRRERPISTCPVCHELASAAIFQCGHFAQAM
jgi:hypothetical protein